MLIVVNRCALPQTNVCMYSVVFVWLLEKSTLFNHNNFVVYSCLHTFSTWI